MERRRIGNVAFVDVFLLLLIVALALIHPPVDPTIELRPKALLTVEWDGKSHSDVDTHVITPSGAHMSFVSKDINGQVVLTRDDTGANFTKDGELIEINVETTEFYMLDDGIYKVAVRLFGTQDNGPIPVEVRLHTLTPFSRLVDEIIILEHNKQTIAVVEIHIKDDKIVKIDTDVNFRLPGKSG